MTSLKGSRCTFAAVVLLCSSLALAGAARAAGAPRVGQTPPPLSVAKWIQVPDATDKSWEGLRGKVVVLEFWATWCGPCIQNIPHFNELSEHFKNDPVVFISLTDESEYTVTRFLSRKPISGWIALDDAKKTNRAYGITSIPQTFLIGRDGKLIGHAHPAGLNAELIEKALRGESVEFGEDEERAPAATQPLARGERRWRNPSFYPGRFPGEGLAGDNTPAPLLQVIIRPAYDSSGGASGSSGNGQTLLNVKLKDLLSHIYDDRIDVRGDLPEDSYDVVACVPKERPQLLKPMLREAIERTFSLTSRTERRAVDVYVLQETEAALTKLQPTVSTGGSSTSSKLEDGKLKLSVINGRPGALASTLEGALGRPVLDETKLRGGYDFEISWQPKSYDSAAAALEKELGLRLVPAQRELPYIVIESAKP